MFTGIIQEIGRLKKRINQEQRYQLTVETREITKKLSRGDSIAVNGVCLTVVDYTTNSFTVDVMPVTLDQTNLGRLNPGARLNLEPAVSPRELLGGHLVTGHIDDIGLVRYRQSRGNSLLVDIEIPSGLTHLIVDKGSIALNGVSLTVAGISENVFRVSLIPETRDMSNLGQLKPGDEVNLEADIIAKYVASMLDQRDEIGVDRDLLERQGFI